MFLHFDGAQNLKRDLLSREIFLLANGFAMTKYGNIYILGILAPSFYHKMHKNGESDFCLLTTALGGRVAEWLGRVLQIQSTRPARTTNQLLDHACK